jgi:hypothetical protein
VDGTPAEGAPGASLGPGTRTDGASGSAGAFGTLGTGTLGVAGALGALGALGSLGSVCSAGALTGGVFTPGTLTWPLATATAQAQVASVSTAMDAGRRGRERLG